MQFAQHPGQFLARHMEQRGSGAGGVAASMLGRYCGYKKVQAHLQHALSPSIHGTHAGTEIHLPPRVPPGVAHVGQTMQICKWAIDKADAPYVSSIRCFHKVELLRLPDEIEAWICALEQTFGAGVLEDVLVGC